MGDAPCNDADGGHERLIGRAGGLVQRVERPNVGIVGLALSLPRRPGMVDVGGADILTFDEDEHGVEPKERLCVGLAERRRRRRGADLRRDLVQVAQPGARDDGRAWRRA
jgi:hypothetical protein